MNTETLDPWRLVVWSHVIDMSVDTHGSPNHVDKILPRTVVPERKGSKTSNTTLTISIPHQEDRRVVELEALDE